MVNYTEVTLVQIGCYATSGDMIKGHESVLDEL